MLWEIQQFTRRVAIRCGWEFDVWLLVDFYDDECLEYKNIYKSFKRLCSPPLNLIYLNDKV